MPKLTLSVDGEVIERAKRYARRHGVSVSEMVESYLAAVAGQTAKTPGAPVLRSLRGSLRKADIEAYRKRLAAKYR